MNCNRKQTSCTRITKNPRLGCPNCEFTIQYKQYKNAVEKELRQVRATREEARQWNSDYLTTLFGEVSYQAGIHKISGPKWSIVTAILVSVYRDESDKIKMAENYALMQNIEASKLKTTPVDEDEGDFD